MRCWGRQLVVCTEGGGSCCRRLNPRRALNLSFKSNDRPAGRFLWGKGQMALHLRV